MKISKTMIRALMKFESGKHETADGLDENVQTLNALERRGFLKSLNPEWRQVEWHPTFWKMFEITEAGLEKQRSMYE